MGRNKGGKNKRFSFEEKSRVCKRYYEHQLSLGDLAKEENISFGNLGRWVVLYRDLGEEGLKPKKKGRPYRVKSEPGMSELEQIKLENLALRVEVERLKKGYTVKGVGSKKVYVTIDGKIIK
jgi:transposase-like protein